MDMPAKYIVVVVGIFLFFLININYEIIPFIYFLPVVIAAPLIYIINKYDIKNFLGDFGSEFSKRDKFVNEIHEAQEESSNLCPFKWENEYDKIHIDRAVKEWKGKKKQFVGIVGPYKHPQNKRKWGRIIWQFPDNIMKTWDPELPGKAKIRENPLHDLGKVLDIEKSEEEGDELKKMKGQTAVTINQPPYGNGEDEE